MIKFEYEGMNYSISFQYRRNKRLQPIATTVFVEQYRWGPGEKVVAGLRATTVNCHSEDRFSRVIGRKLALTRFLSGVADPEFRKLVWTEYKKSGAKLVEGKKNVVRV